MILTKKKRRFDLIFPLISLALIAALWAICAAAVGMDLIVPSIGQTFASLGGLLATAQFYLAVAATLGRAVAAFALSLLCASITAVLSARFRAVDKTLAPLVAIVRALPTMSIILLALLWMSSANVPILVAFTVLFPMQHTAIVHSIRQVDPDLKEMAKIYRVSKKRILFGLYLPQMRSDLLSMTGATLSFSVKLTIAAEVLAQTRDSMGLHMQLSKVYLDTAGLFAWTIAAVVLGGLLELSVAMIAKMATGRAE